MTLVRHYWEFSKRSDYKALTSANNPFISLNWLHSIYLVLQTNTILNPPVLSESCYYCVTFTRIMQFVKCVTYISLTSFAWVSRFSWCCHPFLNLTIICKAWNCKITCFSHTVEAKALVMSSFCHPFVYCYIALSENPPSFLLLPCHLSPSWSYPK